jgi:hypothetical protein
MVGSVIEYAKSTIIGVVAYNSVSFGINYYFERFHGLGFFQNYGVNNPCAKFGGGCFHGIFDRAFTVFADKLKISAHTTNYLPA